MAAVRLTCPGAGRPTPAALAAYLRGWWDGALSGGWPITPRGLCPLLQAWWEKGVHDGRLSRILARRRGRAA